MWNLWIDNFPVLVPLYFDLRNTQKRVTEENETNNFVDGYLFVAHVNVIYFWSGLEYFVSCLSALSGRKFVERMSRVRGVYCRPSLPSPPLRKSPLHRAVRLTPSRRQIVGLQSTCLDCASVCLCGPEIILR